MFGLSVWIVFASERTSVFYHTTQVTQVPLAHDKVDYLPGLFVQRICDPYSVVLVAAVGSKLIHFIYEVLIDREGTFEPISDFLDTGEHGCGGNSRDTGYTPDTTTLLDIRD